MTEPSRRGNWEQPFFEVMRQQILQTPLPGHKRFGWRLRRQSLGLHKTRRARLASAAFAAVAVAAVLGVVLSRGGSPSPAWAVTIGPNNLVTITLHDIRHVRSLNARLAAMGIRARLVPIVHGCVAPVHSTSDALGKAHNTVIPRPARTLEVDGLMPLYSDTMSLATRPGRTVVIPYTRSGELGNFAGDISGYVVGAAPKCVGYSGRIAHLSVAHPRG
jgi:hypothetical protein